MLQAIVDRAVRTSPVCPASFPEILGSRAPLQEIDGEGVALCSRGPLEVPCMVWWPWAGAARDGGRSLGGFYRKRVKGAATPDVHMDTSLLSVARAVGQFY